MFFSLALRGRSAAATFLPVEPPFIKEIIMLRRTIWLSAALSLVTAGAAHAADAAAGEAKAKVCGDCHAPAEDFKGVSEADLTAKIKGVVSGSHKHPKKLKLTDDDVANIAAFWASAAK
jgi:cytochrome c553